MQTATWTGGSEHSLWHAFTLCLAGDPVTPATLWQSWSLAPAVVVPLALLLAVYRRREVRRGRSAASSPAAAEGRRWFLAGWLLLVFALVTPLCRLSSTLVWVHMVQFMLLSCIAPTCLALGFTKAVRAASAGTGRRRSSAPGLGFLTALYGATIWLWHAPAVYHVVLTDPLWHWLAYAALIVVSTLFWMRVLERRDEHAGEALGAVLVTMLHGGLLGALLTFAPRVLYPVLSEGAAAWNLPAIQDQQLAGLIMWVGGGAFFLLVALWLVATWLRTASASEATLPCRAYEGHDVKGLSSS